LADLDTSYPGGLAAYLSKAKLLLKESADGTNPFDEYTAVVPTGEVLTYSSNTKSVDDKTDTAMTFTKAEEIGLSACSNIVFCLVAGGLGERLGYSGIKLSLSTDLCTDECYLSLYAKYILALQYRAREMTGSKDLQIPLAIMTSGDTDAATRQLLLDNNNFGFGDGQVTVVMQDKVAALCNGNAGLALEDDDRWCIQTKPHGHGDVHHLLYREGLVDQWAKEGKTHIVFLQDTNALVINSVLPTLGVSVQKGFHMNSICIPRLAGEAAGAIARLE
jgi:UDP-sugar pyrophosphorylase